MNEKILQGILIAIIILGSGYLAYSFVVLTSDTPETVEVVTTIDDVEEIDTSGWQTYRNEEFGFEFSYPRGYEIQEKAFIDDINNIPYVGYFFLDTDDNHEYTCGEESIIIEITPEERRTTKYVESVFRSDVLFGNNKTTAYKYINTPGCPLSKEKNKFLPPRMASFINLQDNFYIVELLSNEENLEELFEQILSTFKFIEPTDTSNWQTYRNEEFGFSFRYDDKLFTPEDLISIVSPEEFSLGSFGGDSVYYDESKGEFIVDAQSKGLGVTEVLNPEFQSVNTEIYLWTKGDAGFTEKRYFTILNNGDILKFTFKYQSQIKYADGTFSEGLTSEEYNVRAESARELVLTLELLN